MVHDRMSRVRSVEETNRMIEINTAVLQGSSVALMATAATAEEAVVALQALEGGVAGVLLHTDDPLQACCSLAINGNGLPQSVVAPRGLHCSTPHGRQCLLPRVPQSIIVLSSKAHSFSRFPPCASLLGKFCNSWCSSSRQYAKRRAVSGRDVSSAPMPCIQALCPQSYCYLQTWNGRNSLWQHYRPCPAVLFCKRVTWSAR